MTDKKRVEERLNCKASICACGYLTRIEQTCAKCLRRKDFLDGLAEGRKLGKEELKLNPVRYVVCDLSEPNNPISICRKRITELEEELAELKAHCKAVDEVNVKLRCCENCKNHYFHFGHELDCRLENDCELDEHGDYKYDKWEMAE